MVQDIFGNIGIIPEVLAFGVVMTGEVDTVEVIYKTIGGTGYFEGQFKPINRNGCNLLTFFSAVNFVQFVHQKKALVAINTD